MNSYHRHPLVIIGGGGHARDIASIVLSANSANSATEQLEICGYISPEAGDVEAWSRLGIPWLGGDSALSTLPADTAFTVGIGDAVARRRLDRAARDAGLRPRNIVHPSAILGRDTHLSEGVVLFPGVVLTTNVRLGRHVHVNTGASLSHDCRVADYVTVNPGARLCGWVTVGSESMIGAGAVVNERISVGFNVKVGSGAVVVQDVEDNLTVIGVPAREVGSHHTRSLKGET